MFAKKNSFSFMKPLLYTKQVLIFLMVQRAFVRGFYIYLFIELLIFLRYYEEKKISTATATLFLQPLQPPSSSISFLLLFLTYSVNNAV